MPLSAWVTPHYTAASRKTRVLLDSMWPFEFIRLNQRTNVSALDTGSEHWTHLSSPALVVRVFQQVESSTPSPKLYPRSLKPKDALGQLKIACQPAQPSNRSYLGGELQVKCRERGSFGKSFASPKRHGLPAGRGL